MTGFNRIQQGNTDELSVSSCSKRTRALLILTVAYAFFKQYPSLGKGWSLEPTGSEAVNRRDIR